MGAKGLHSGCAALDRCDGLHTGALEPQAETAGSREEIETSDQEIGPLCGDVLVDTTVRSGWLKGLRALG